mmetsp:Transcript_20190/g.28399  ORF Transcript_20190/g.28399 Transcript_20190/m.28399 type:complete len:229 (-) Transcript_20190:349-1035(-)
MKGGYLSRLNRRGVNKSALDPLSLHEILEVKAGCIGYDHTQLPISGKSKKADNKHISLFVTIKASPTPLASNRLYYLKFKSRSARNDLLMGLRSLLADLQIHEGISVSSLHTLNPDSQNKMIPYSDVHAALDKEREAYDRLLLMMLQGTSDLKEKEDDLLSMKAKLDNVFLDLREKDRIQANDSKLIMQLSKKLETLLMDNEDLREQNDRLNDRLIAIQCEKMNNYRS